MEDAAILLRVMAGYDPRDPSTVNVPVSNYARALNGDIKGLRVGMPTNHSFDRLDKEVDEAVRKAIKELERLGASVQDVSFLRIGSIAIVHACIVLTEAATYHEKWMRTRPYDYAPDVRFSLEWSKLFMRIHPRARFLNCRSQADTASRRRRRAPCRTATRSSEDRPQTIGST